MKGRKPKPTQLKVLSGTDQPCRINPNEAKSKPVDKVPSAPKWLSSLGKKIYKDTTRQLMASKVLTPVDLQMLITYCQEYANYIEIMMMFQPDKNGNVQQERVILTKTKQGTMHQVNPLIKIAQASLDKAKSIGVEYGLTPSSRSRVNQVKEDEQDEFTRFLKQRA